MRRSENICHIALGSAVTSTYSKNIKYILKNMSILPPCCTVSSLFKKKLTIRVRWLFLNKMETD